MSRISILCPSAMGHVYPSLALSSTLRKRGHDVQFFQVAIVGENVERIERAGFTCQVYGSPALQRYLNEAYAAMGLQTGLRALRTVIEIVRRREAETIGLLQDLFADSRADFAMIDRLNPGAAAVAQRLRLPFASVSNALVLNQDSAVPPFFTFRQPHSILNRLRNRFAYGVYSMATRSILRIVNDYRTASGLSVVNSLDANVQGALQLSQQPEFFTFPRDKPIANMHYCGPFTDASTRTTVEFPWERLTGKPVVYMSLGTLQNRTDFIYRAVAEACSTLDVDLVVTTGGVDHEFRPELPGRPIVAQFVPQLDLLAKSALCVTHAGLNTTLESLAAGVPMVAIPIANDQPGVAARIDYYCFGRALSTKALTATGVRSTIQEVLTCRTIKENVKNAQSRLLKIDGCRHAADLVEQWMCTEK